MKTKTNLKPIPKWAKMPSRIVFDGCLRKYRARYLDGYFEWGGNDLGDTIAIQPLETRWISESRYGRRENYFDVCFIDSENVASVLSLQRDSATNVAGWLANIQGGRESIDPKSLKIQLQLTEEKTDGGTSYYVVKVIGFEFVSEGEWKNASEFLSCEKYQANRWQGVVW